MFKKRSSTIYWCISLLFLILASLACGTSSTDELEAAVSTAAEEVASAVEQSAETVAEEVVTEVEAEVVEEEKTEVTQEPQVPAEDIQPLVLVDYGFGQNETYGSFAFIVENPNQNSSINSTQYQIAVYDADDVVLETDSGYIDVILPGQTLGIGGDLYLDEGQEISKIEVQISDGDAETAEQIPTFGTENTVYIQEDYYSYVTGIITSPYDTVLSDLRVSAVLYDAQGSIIGGGYTYLNFIQPNGSTGVSISVDDYGDVASVELYPIVSSFSFWFDEDEIPTDAQDIEVVKYGFGADDWSVGYGFLLENSNSNYSVEDSQYHITGYSADDHVLCTGEGYINVLLPGQVLGVGGDLYPYGDEAIVRIDVQVMHGEYIESEGLPEFTYENVTFSDSSYWPQVTGTVVNPYGQEISDLKVNAIVYNDGGDIIGGGFTYLDFLPANGKAAVEVSVTLDGSPGTVEIYATLSGLSEFSD